MPQITGKLTLTLHSTFSCFIIFITRVWFLRLAVLLGGNALVSINSTKFIMGARSA